MPLLPRSRKDFVLTACSCPDDFNPCKHIAGIYYRLAARLDQDPFLLFELRGLSRMRLHQALVTTPLGQALASLRPEAEDPTAPLEPAASFFTRPVIRNDAAPIPKIPGAEETTNTTVEHGPPTPPNPTGTRASQNAAGTVSKSLDYYAFWSGRHRLPTEIEPATPPVLPAILVRKAGDYPGFWDRDSSFIGVMEELYQRVREKHRDLL